MRRIIVSKNGSGDFDTIQKAIDSANEGDCIFICKGTYKERIEVRKDGLTFEGEDKDGTIITESFYAKMVMEDGTNRGTFRSYTALFNANDLTIKNMTIENAAGFGTQVGQAVAVYAEGDNINFEDCRILGHQDTLFTGPLPLKEIKPGGFVGPTEFSDRRVGRQSYTRCYICGEVDFIFGSAIAFFYDCDIYALDRNKEVNAFYTAPSTYEGQKYGYVFDTCRFSGNCPKGTVFMGRPWRENAKAVFLHCEIDDNVNELGFDDWNKPEAHEKSFFAEYDCHGIGSDTTKRASFAHQLSEEEAADYTREKVLAPIVR